MALWNIYSVWTLSAQGELNMLMSGCAHSGKSIHGKRLLSILDIFVEIIKIISFKRHRFFLFRAVRIVNAPCPDSECFESELRMVPVGILDAPSRNRKCFQSESSTSPPCRCVSLQNPLHTKTLKQNLDSCDIINCVSCAANHSLFISLPI